MKPRARPPSWTPPSDRIRQAVAQARVTAILSHHHFDRRRQRALGRWASHSRHEKDEGRLPGLTKPLAQGDEVAVGRARARVLHIPGHTLGHIAYAFPGHVFTGDTLFFAGCGRLFEGTPEMMVESLTRKLGGLPDDTRVYCGHEYTEKNLEFALSLEPGNARIRATIDEVRAKRRAGSPRSPRRSVSRRRSTRSSAPPAPRSRRRSARGILKLAAKSRSSPASGR
jgi:hydroxyacylglutathione hydrolase